MALAAIIMNLIVAEAGGDAGCTASGPCMTVSAVRGQRHPIGVVGSAVLGGGNSMTSIALSATAIANGD